MVSLKSVEETMTQRGKIVEGMIALERPELIDLFSTYQNEAIEARRLLESSLIDLNSGAAILEVGGGILALAIQLASEGFRVTTVEPVGEGFDHISWIMEKYLQTAQEENIDFLLIRDSIENCSFDSKFEFIFSINVMEHLQNPYEVIAQLVNSLTDFGQYRFFCPNYNFPYEPHFAKWMWSRRNGSFYLQPSRISHSIDLYSSINFITTKKLLNATRKANVSLTFNKNALFDLLRRASNDPALRGRHKGIALLANLAVRARLNYLARFVPIYIQPVIDVEVKLKGLNKIL